MTNLENTPQISWRERRRHNKLVHAFLVAAVNKSLPRECPLFVSSRDGVIAWRRADSTFCLQVNPYDQFAWRLTNRGIYYLKLSRWLRQRFVREPNGASVLCRSRNRCTASSCRSSAKNCHSWQRPTSCVSSSQFSRLKNETRSTNGIYFRTIKVIRITRGPVTAAVSSNANSAPALRPPWLR